MTNKRREEPQMWINEFSHFRVSWMNDLGQSEMGKFVIETPKYENKHESN